MELISREEVERLLIKWFTQCTEEEFFDLKKAVDELPTIESRLKEIVDGEEVELDELSYEVGYTRGQMAERRQIIQVIKDYFEASGLCDEAIIESLERYADMRGEE